MDKAIAGKEGLDMDTAYRRRAAGGGRRVARKGRKPDSRRGERQVDRRLVQLVVSLVLFLLVYAGRGSFPGQADWWREALADDVDFRGAFQRFGDALSQGEPVGEALQDLCVTALGGETEQTESPEPLEEVEPVLLSGTRRMGLAYAGTHGATQGIGEAEPTETPEQTIEQPSEQAPEQLPEQTPEQPSEEPEAEPSQQVVTAVAQAYTADGIKLPSNVSFDYYELGLDKTICPVQGSVTSTFGYRDSPLNGNNEFHLALDIGCAEGTEIGAFADGVVRYIGESDEFGQYLMIDHANHVASFYAHCSKLLVHKGDTVTCGQTVALVGHTGNATGPHLHLTIEKDDIRLDPAYYVDPS